MLDSIFRSTDQKNSKRTSADVGVTRASHIDNRRRSCVDPSPIAWTLLYAWSPTALCSENHPHHLQMSAGRVSVRIGRCLVRVDTSTYFDLLTNESSFESENLQMGFFFAFQEGHFSRFIEDGGTSLCCFLTHAKRGREVPT